MKEKHGPDWPSSSKKDFINHHYRLRMTRYTLRPIFQPKILLPVEFLSTYQVVSVIPKYILTKARNGEQAIPTIYNIGNPSQFSLSETTELHL